MTSIINAAPRAYLLGVQDLSGRTPVYEQEAIPQHLPHIFFLAERGTGVPQLAIGDGLNKLYGAKSFDLRLKAGDGGYATHQTLLATIMSQNANQIMAQRLIPSDAKTARFRMSVDVLETTDEIYDRDENGDVKKDAAGRPLINNGSVQGTWNSTTSGAEYPDADGITVVEPTGTIDEGTKWLDLLAVGGPLLKYYRTGAFVSAGKAGSGNMSAAELTAVGLTYSGTWNPTTNTPVVPAAAVGNTNFFYVVSVAGTSTAPIAATFAVGDILLSDGTAWAKVTGGKTITGDSWTIGANVYKATQDLPGTDSAINWGLTTPGLAIRQLAWSIQQITSIDDWGTGTVNNSGPLTDGSAVSKTYPIFDFEVSSPGKWGNGAGIRFSAPNADSAIPFDTRLIKEQLTTMFRMQVVEKADEVSSAKIIETRYGEQFIDFSLKPNAVDDRASQEIYLPTVYQANYISYDTLPPSHGTFSDMHVYEDNISTVLTDLYTLERANLANEMGWTTARINEFIPVDGKYTINFMTAVAWDGSLYESIRMASDAQLLAMSGTQMKSNYTHYALGGNDGTLSFAVADTLTGVQCENYGDLTYQRDPAATEPHPSDVPLDFMDTAKWPQSAIWDTGFQLATKYKLLVPMGRRKDMWVALSTQVIGPGEIQNTPSKESSIAIVLQQAARMYPESEYYGTKTCRAIVVGHSGELNSSAWRGLAPMTVDLAAKVATYMGASNGQWKPGANFDISPKNIVSMFRTDSVNATFKNADVRNEDWANGLIWVQNFDRRSLFYPGIQTVYDDDTSVLNSLFNIIAVVELEKVCEQTWRELTGIQTLTVAQFIERSDDLIKEKVANRFDDKFIIIPETYLTEGDEQRGYSWSCKVNMYAANMRTVGTYTIVSRRIEDYQP